VGVPAYYPQWVARRSADIRRRQHVLRQLIC
jgi:hypothetical protein